MTSSEVANIFYCGALFIVVQFETVCGSCSGCCCCDCCCCGYYESASFGCCSCCCCCCRCCSCSCCTWAPLNFNYCVNTHTHSHNQIDTYKCNLVFRKLPFFIVLVWKVELLNFQLFCWALFVCLVCLRLLWLHFTLAWLIKYFVWNYLAPILCHLHFWPTKNCSQKLCHSPNPFRPLNDFSATRAATVN